MALATPPSLLERRSARERERERERERDRWITHFKQAKKQTIMNGKRKYFKARNRNWPINTHEHLFTKLLLPTCPKKVGFSEIVEGKTYNITPSMFSYH
jgi:hypothetical protein